MEKAIILESVSLRPDGGVAVRIQKTIMDGDEVFSREPHMYTVDGDHDLAESLAALDEWLASNKWPVLSADQRKFLAGQAGSAAVVQARAAASDFAQGVRAQADSDAQAAITLAMAEAAKQIAEADARADAAESRAAELERALAASEARVEALTSAAATAAEAMEGLEARLQKVEAAVASAAEPV